MAGRVIAAGPDADGVARLCISHPGKLNALSVGMWHGLRQGFEVLSASGCTARVVIVHGDGGTFAAGGDIEEFPQFRFDEEKLRHFHEDVVAPALQAVLDCPLPVIAQIEGACVGGGLEIAACCDLRIAGAGSRPAFDEATRRRDRGRWQIGNGATLRKTCGHCRAPLSRVVGSGGRRALTLHVHLPLRLLTLRDPHHLALLCKADRAPCHCRRRCRCCCRRYCPWNGRY